MNNARFIFKKKTDEFEYNPKKELRTFYQICQMKNPRSGHYTVRKIIFTELGEILKTYEKEYSFARVEKFMKNNKQNKYCMYPVFNIDLINLPEPSYLLEERSELLNNDNTEYDYARV